MATGYTKAYSRSTGNTILASDFNTEFQSIEDAFDESSGHTHDGTTQGGAYVPLISDANNRNSVELDTTNHEIDFNLSVSSSKVRQMVLTDGALLPDTDNDIDLGSATFEFKDLYIDGTANIDSLVADTADINGGTFDGVVGGTTPAAGSFTTLTSSGNTDFSGTVDFDGTVRFNSNINFVGGTFDGSLIPTLDNNVDLGSASNEWRDLYIDGTANIDSLVSGSVAITGGTIDGTVIGGSTAAAGSFTTVSASSTLTVTGTATFNGDVTLGNASSDDINMVGRTVGDIVPSVNNTYDLGSSSLIFNQLHTSNLTVNTSNVICGDSASDLLGADAGSVTISTGNSGATSANVAADDLLIEGSGDTGMTIFSGTTNTGQLRFGDSGGGGRFIISYDHDADDFKLIHNAVSSELHIDSTGRFIFGPSGADAVGASLGSLTVSTGDSGVSSPPGGADELIIESDAATMGMSICSTASNSGQIAFVNPTDGNNGGFVYDHSADVLNIRAIPTGSIIRLSPENSTYAEFDDDKIFIANSGVVPGSNPTGGGYLYVEGGALKYRGSSGTVTTIANA